MRYGGGQAIGGVGSRICGDIIEEVPVYFWSSDSKAPVCIFRD